MDTSPLSAPADYPAIFRQRILVNAHYWHDFVSGHREEVTALNRERQSIVKAVTFGLDLPEAWQPVTGLMVNFSPHLERRGDWAGWNRLLERAIEQAERVGDPATAIHLSTFLARLCQRQNRFAETIHHYRRVIRLARRTGDDFSLARACSNLGFLYTEYRVRWQRAEILCRRALAIFERLDSNHGRAHTENHLGVLYTRQGQWEQAAPCFERACAIWKVMGDQHGLVYGYLNLGMLYNEMAQPDEALPFLENALYQARLTGEEVMNGIIYRNMGDTYVQKSQLDLAEHYIRLAEAAFRRYLKSADLTSLEHNFIELYLKQGNLAEARRHIEAGLAAWRSLNNKYGEIQIMIYFSEYELLCGNRQQAEARLQEVQRELSRHDPARRYRRLYRLVDELRLRLAGDAACTGHG